MRSIKELSMLKRDFDTQVSCGRALEVKSDGLVKELEAVRSKTLKGWVMQQSDGSFVMYTLPFFIKQGGTWKAVGAIAQEVLTEEELAGLGYPIVNWSDDEPTPIYK